MIITIDGTGGSGKGTVAKEIARRLAYIYFDTGLTYRALGQSVGSDKINDAAHCEAVLSELQFSFQQGELIIPNSPSLATEEIGQLASKVAVHQNIREKMVRLQQQLISNNNAVIDGRDAGTHIFPNAEVKIFLYCNPLTAAFRRARQLHQRENVLLIAESIAQRNHREITRTHSPLQPAPNAFLIDTTNLSIDDVFNQSWEWITITFEGLNAWEKFKKQCQS